MSDSRDDRSNFRNRRWHYTYKTSAVGPDGEPVDILHDFYIPVLQRAVQYDRVAGYFRSTSLAAASQGFSAFTAAEGKMRIIVGADMAEDDVAAILQGNADLMALRLNDSLGDESSWPTDVKNGVELLCWMVANGYLEVRVAFRIHKETGHPLAFGSTQDGYVHEKWAVFTDAAGNRIYISGSLNESVTALSHNAENIDVHADWWGGTDQQRAEEACSTFDSVWDNQNPHLKVLSLPEAVRQRLVQIASNVSMPNEIDGSNARPPELIPPSVRERIRWSIIKNAPTMPNGRFVGMQTAPVEPWPHQAVVARRLVETWPYSYLLCDEVGLGKTIEAGLAIRSLWLSGLAKRILIAPPASLARQWQREMASKFLMPFARTLTGVQTRHEYLFPEEAIEPAESIYSPDLCITSTGLMSRHERQIEMKRSQSFDIALVDEAHYARRQNAVGEHNTRLAPRYGNLYSAIQDSLRDKAKSLWLATATPMQLDWIEVFDLIHLTRRVGAFQDDPTITRTYYDALGNLVRGMTVKEHQWNLLRAAINALRVEDPFLQSYLDDAVVDGRIRTAAKQWLEKGRVPRGSDVNHILRLIFSAAPLSRVMLRHTRSLLEIYRDRGQLRANLATRKLLPMQKIVFSSQEQQCYDELESYCKGLMEQILSHAGERSQLGFYLSFLRLRFASSLFAIRETLRRRLDRVELTLEHKYYGDDADLAESLLADDGDEEEDERIVDSFLKKRSEEDLKWERRRLKQMLDTLHDLTAIPSKTKELLRILDKRKLEGNRVRQTVVFTRFYDTLKDLVDHLRRVDRKLLIGTYSGQGGFYVHPDTLEMKGVERDEIKHRFIRGEIDVLFCTDAAAEGLNLQTADLLINFDLPWNPMKVEQRIGRIDRIGQKHEEVFVLNMCYQGSAEETVYDRLLQRLREAGQVVGSQQISLLPVAKEDFLALASGEMTPEALEHIALERLALQRKRTESMEIPAGDMYEIYNRMAESLASEIYPITLGDIWTALVDSDYLKSLGGGVMDDYPVYSCGSYADMPRGIQFTTDRDIFEQGMPGSSRPLHFASYGNPFFDSIVSIFDGFDMPKCAKWIEETIPDIGVTVRVLVVVENSGNNVRTARVIQSYNDFESVTLAEDADITEFDLTSIKKNFHDTCREEFSPARAVGRVEQENRDAAAAQRRFTLMAGKSLLQPPKSLDEDGFWQIVKDVEDSLNGRDAMLVHSIPLDALKSIANRLLFEVKAPKLGHDTTVLAPSEFLNAALDQACRVADAMKIKKSDLTRGQVVGRMERILSDIG